MKKILLYIWQLPQNLLALFLIAISKDKIKREFVCNDGSSVTIYFVNSVFGAGVSLGDYILLDKSCYLGLYTVACNTFINTVNHEHGHQIQSKYFGPLYLLVIGITSAIFNNLLDRLMHKSWSYSKRINWYYNRFPEKWADNLGGVNR